MKLSEEEIIKEVESAIWFMKEDNYNVNTFVKAIQGLLDLYKEKNKQIQVEIEGRNILVGLNENLKEELNKEKEKNKELLENATVTYFNDEELKDKLIKAKEYIENEMYINENPTICGDEEDTLIDLLISLILYNEDLRELLRLLEEE